MEDMKRREVMNSRFNISLDDDMLRRLSDLTTLDEDAYNHGFREGEEAGHANGFNEGKIEGRIETRADSVVFYAKEMGVSLDEAISKYPIPDELRSGVEAKVRERTE